MRRLQTQSLVGMVSGPILWAVHFTLVYVLMSIGCALGLHEARLGGPHLINVVLLLLSVPLVLMITAMAWAAWRARREAPGPDEEPAVFQRRRFMALTALLLHLLSLVGVLWVTLPLLISPPCY